MLTFEIIARGASYFKIGKATYIPSRIKQFGPCQLIAYKDDAVSRAAQKREKELHQQFAASRSPETEIFLLTDEQLHQVVTAKMVPG